MKPARAQLLFYLLTGFALGFFLVTFQTKIYAVNWSFGEDPDGGFVIQGGLVGAGTPTPTPALKVSTGGVITNAQISATNISSADFGANTGGGTYSFPGSVGIGTTAPGTALDVTGDVRASSSLYASGEGIKAKAIGSGYGINFVANTTDAYLDANWYYSAGDKRASAGYTPSIKLGYTDGSIRFLTSGTGLVDSAVTWAEKVSILDSGDVGIGTTAPGEKLVVYGTSANILLKSAASDVGDIVFQESDGNQLGRIWTAGSAATEKLSLSSGDNTADITINESGNVGIGTTIPAAKLDVNGSTRTLGSDIFAQTNNTSTSYIDAPIQIREAQFGASVSYLAPRLSFHWGGVVASQIAIESDGTIAIRNNPGTGYEKFKTAQITDNGTTVTIGGGFVVGGVSGGVVPTGMVAFFNLTACPTGWTAVAAAAGRAIVGRAANESIGSTVGTALTSLLNRTHTHTTPNHQHSIPLNSQAAMTQGYGGTYGWGHSSFTGSGCVSYGCGQGSVWTASGGGGTSGTAATGDVMPYIQYMVCSKN